VGLGSRPAPLPGVAAVAAGTAAVLGVFLPWVEPAIFVSGVSGFRFDAGQLLLVICVVGILLAFALHDVPVVFAITQVLAGMATAVIGLYEVGRIDDLLAGSSSATANVGVGLYLLIGAGCAWVLGGVGRLL